MSITADDIAKVATLARLRIEHGDSAELSQRLSDILGMVDRMQAVATDGVEPMAHPRDEQQRLRADEVTESNQRDAFRAIAPQTEQGLYLVPRVIE